MAPNPFGEGFDSGPEMADLRGEAGQGAGVVAADSVFFDDRAEVLIPVEGRPADAGPFGDRGEGHGLLVAQQLDARLFDPSQRFGRCHPADSSAKRASRRATRRR
jgi:hypothetical protein